MSVIKYNKQGSITTKGISGLEFFPKNPDQMIIRKKDDPELFKQYLNSLSRARRKLYLAKTKLYLEIKKILKKDVD